MIPQNLASNIDFKRAIAQQFDPETDYSQFDEAEVDGAFEATVYQLLMERGVNTQSPTSNVERPMPNAQPLEFGSLIHQVVKWNGKDIGLEFTPGQVRFPRRRNSRKLRSGYGHIRNHLGSDGEALDCYLAPAFFDGNATPSDRCFEVRQLSPEDGDFDELKMLLGYDSLEDAKAAYLREMPGDYFGGIREIDLNELSQYRKNQPQDFSEQLTEIKGILTQLLEGRGKKEDVVLPSPLLPPNFSQGETPKAIAEAVEFAIAPHISKIDLLIRKLDFGEPIALEGEILEDEEYGAIASDNQIIEEAVDDWQNNAPDVAKNVLGEGDDG